MTETAAQIATNDHNAPILTNSLITAEELKEFKELAFKEYGIRLTNEQAFEQATALLSLFDTLITSGLEQTGQRVNINNNSRPKEF